VVKNRKYGLDPALISEKARKKGLDLFTADVRAMIGPLDDDDLSSEPGSPRTSPPPYPAARTTPQPADPPSLRPGND
jgi:hypothetical protein